MLLNGTKRKGKKMAEPRNGYEFLKQLAEKKKQETDINVIIDAVAEKICREKDEKKGRKGGTQLLHTLDGIFVNDTMQPYDADAKKVDLVYPVVTVVDSAFSALGVAAFLEVVSHSARGVCSRRPSITA